MARLFEHPTLRQRRRQEADDSPPNPLTEPVRRRRQPLPSRLERPSVSQPLLRTILLLVLFGLFMLFSASARDSMLEVAREQQDRQEQQLELSLGQPSSSATRPAPSQAVPAQPPPPTDQLPPQTGHPWAYVSKQAVFLVLGLGAMVFFSRVPYTAYANPATIYGVWAGVLLLLALTALVGDTANGSERWLSLGPLRFQPSELAKPAIVLLLAFALSARYRAGPMLAASLASGFMILLIFKQPNLSISLLLSGVYITLMFLGGLALPWFATLVPAACFVAWYVWHTPYQKARILGWWRPWDYPLKEGYNLIQSLYAIGNGGVLGAGYGQGIQKLSYLPFHHTDFIFAVIAEELGLLGTVGTVALYTAFAWYGFTAALRAKNRFGQLLGVGIVCVVLYQAIINMAVATGLFPVTGVTLPLISYGGTSVVVTLAMLGVLLNISRDGNQPAVLVQPKQAPDDEMDA